jgi:glyoxylase-like metal-dependent hydrolase (beta-lactamase superfamily II)
MTNLSRRAALIGSVAALEVATLVSQRAYAALPRDRLTEIGSPGFFKFKVGNFTVVAVNDGYAGRALEGMVLNAPIAEVQRVMADAFLPTDKYNGPYTATFVDTGKMLIALDTGTGGQLAPTAGRLVVNMKSAGIDPTQVDLVVISHCHADHITGLTTAEGLPIYPNAELAISQAEWAWWTEPGNETRSPDSERWNFSNVAKRFGPYAKRLRRFANDGEIAPGIRAIPSHGHTPGHTSVHISDGSAEMIALIDITHRPELFARRPDFHSAYDFDPVAASATRVKILDRVATDRTLVTGYHFPFPAVGHIAKDGSGFRLVPVDWSGTSI